VDQSRLTSAFVGAVEAASAASSAPRYEGVWRYSVVSCDPAAQTITARPLDARMPPLTAVPMAVPGLRLTIAPGSIVMVGFADGGLPTLPYIAQYPQDPAAVTMIGIRGGAVPIALQGSQVTITQAQVTAAGLSNTGGPVTAAAPMLGSITGGSATITGTG